MRGYVEDLLQGGMGGYGEDLLQDGVRGYGEDLLQDGMGWLRSLAEDAGQGV